MAISQQDIKLLWGRAASRCAFPNCRVKLSQNNNSLSSAFIVGEQAHIIAEELNGPRGNSSLTINERNSYHNLILLCPTHHTIIDKNPEDYPSEKLYLIKSQHELWVEHTLGQSTDNFTEKQSRAKELVYADLIDAVVTNCKFVEWEQWTSKALPPLMRWHTEDYDRIYRFRQKILRANWPKTFPELERAIQTLSIIMLDAVATFWEHAEREHDSGMVEIRFYKVDVDQRDRELINILEKEFDYWISKCFRLVFDATKAANWVADLVRRDINPQFFAIEGKFALTHGPYDDLMFRTEIPEFTEEEKNSLPQKLISNSEF